MERGVESAVLGPGKRYLDWDPAGHSTPAMTDAPRLPGLCTAASNPNSKPRRSAGAIDATAACFPLLLRQMAARKQLREGRLRL